MVVGHARTCWCTTGRRRVAEELSSITYNFKAQYSLQIASWDARNRLSPYLKKAWCGIAYYAAKYPLTVDSATTVVLLPLPSLLLKVSHRPYVCRERWCTPLDRTSSILPTFWSNPSRITDEQYLLTVHGSEGTINGTDDDCISRLHCLALKNTLIRQYPEW